MRTLDTLIIDVDVAATTDAEVIKVGNIDIVLRFTVAVSEWLIVPVKTLLLDLVSVANPDIDRKTEKEFIITVLDCVDVRLGMIDSVLDWVTKLVNDSRKETNVLGE